MFIENIICPACGAACDDIQVELGDHTIEVKNVCKIGNARFQAIRNLRRIRQPLIKAGGRLKPVSWDETLGKAADILTSA